MILPTVRASFGRVDAMQLVQLLGRHDEELRDAAMRRLEEHGLDALLDDPRVLNALLTDPEIAPAPAVVFYVLVRHALLEGGIDDRATADYVTSLVMAFGRSRRAYRLSENLEEEYYYLVDMVQEMSTATGERAFLLRAHLGNFALWLAGLFPDFLEARTRRKGAPPIEYYERMGASGYRGAAKTKHAERLGIDGVFREVAEHFSGVRVALNRISDRYLWPTQADPVNRLLREITGRAR